MVDSDAPNQPRGVVGAVVVVVFVGAWLVAGIRGMVIDDSRFVWGMFPYHLAVEVEDVRYVDAHGVVLGHWQMKKPRLPPPLQPGRADQGFGYGQGAWDTLLQRVGAVAWSKAPPGTAVVEVVSTTTRSERAPQTDIIRVLRP